MYRRTFGILFFILTLCHNIQASDVLFHGGRSAYSIVLTTDASSSEQTAAKELQDIIREISGAYLPIVQKPTEKAIYIGWTAQTGKPRLDDSDEGFTYKTSDGNLYIYGGSERGTMYGVFSFLEHELGVHWYTRSFTKLVKKDQYILPSLSHTEKPVIRQRLDFYYEALRHHEWSAHNLLNTQYQLSQTPYGPMSSYWGMHTFHKLMPPSVYFNEHPEYYSVYKGQRSDKAQLCLSNRQMRTELTKNLLNVIDKNPGYWCYDVSQNDNPWPCECPTCQRLTKQYGGNSGVMLWFVNQVAKDVKHRYPNVYIGTFAYRYTRQAPKSKIRPADNVVIRLCDIECCMAHPLETCPQNRSFLTDMNDWSRIAKNIYVWDYTTGFENYLLPFPNIKALTANLQYFCRSNVIGILEEGTHNTPWGEFSELKQWLVAKLLWNPYQNADSLATMFINDYYGNAAPYIKAYYDLCQRQITADIHFTIKIDSRSNLYSDSFIVEGTELMRKALTSVKGYKEEEKRTRHIAAQLYYLKLQRNWTNSLTDGTLQELKNILRDDPTRLSEHGLTLEKILKEHAYY